MGEGVRVPVEVAVGVLVREGVGVRVWVPVAVGEGTAVSVGAGVKVVVEDGVGGCVGDIAAMSAGVGDVPQPARTPAAIDSSRSRVRKVPPALL